MIVPAPRRLVSAAAVLLLHLAVIGAFAFAFRLATNVPAVTHEVEISFPPRTHRRSPELNPPQLTRPEVPNVIAPTILQTNPSVPATPSAGAISGVGRALFGCDPATFDRLSTEARARCLHFVPGRPHEQSVLLGPPPDPKSPFTKEIEQRFRKAQPIDRPCPSGSYNDLRGLPCFGFDPDSPLLPGR